VVAADEYAYAGCRAELIIKLLSSFSFHARSGQMQARVRVASCKALFFPFIVSIITVFSFQRKRRWVAWPRDLYVGHWGVCLFVSNHFVSFLRLYGEDYLLSGAFVPSLDLATFCSSRGPA